MKDSRFSFAKYMYTVGCVSRFTYT